MITRLWIYLYHVKQNTVNQSIVKPLNITSNFPIVRRGFVVLIVYATMAWYKIVIERSVVVYHEISHLTLVFSWYKTLLYTEEVQVTPAAVPLESIA